MNMPSTFNDSRGKSLFLAAALAIFPVLTSPLALAFGGGNGDPFSNGTFFPNEGTFQTTIRGKNLSGVATFSTGSSSNSTSSSTGTFSVAFQGVSYVGNVDGSIDSASGTIAAALESSVNRSGSGSATSTIASSFEAVGTMTLDGGTETVNIPDQVTIGTTTLAGGTTNQVVPVTTTVTLDGGTSVTLQTTTVTVDNTLNVPPGGITTTTTTAPVTLDNAQITQTVTDQQVETVTLPSTLVNTTNTVTGRTSTNNLPDTTVDVMGWVDEVATATYNDTLYASGSFTGKLKNSYPNQIFKGSGSMSFTAINFDLAPPQLVTTSVGISVKGVRVSDSAQSYSSQTVVAPSVLTTIEFQNRTSTTN